MTRDIIARELWHIITGNRSTDFDNASEEWRKICFEHADCLYAALTPKAPPQTPPDADEAKRDAWNEFETDHLTDGKGQVAAQVYARCREAFDAHWPQGWEKANAAAFAALSPPDAGIGSDGAGERI